MNDEDEVQTRVRSILGSDKPGQDRHGRPGLYERERQLLIQLGLGQKRAEVNRLLLDKYGVSSHAKLSHLQHWQWVCYLEDEVVKLRR